MTLQANAQYSLKALTSEARSALGSDVYSFAELPLRVGRDTRTLNGPVPREIAERRASGMEPNNDLYLREAGHEVYVSREHFMIDCVDGEYRLLDRLSALGTWVEGRLIGGDRRGGDCRLVAGDIIIPGSYKSGFIFKFCVGAL
jgi:FHA domain